MSDEKKQLGKILLKRQVVTQADLDRTLAEPGKGPSANLPLASRLIARGLVRESDALRGLSEQLGVPAVDVERIGISTAHLLLAEDFAKRRKALVLFADETRVLVAFANPDDTALIEQIAALTGRAVSPYVALSLPLHRALEEAYGAARIGKDTYYGRHARTAENRETLLGLATFLPTEKRSDDAAVFTDDNLRGAAADETLSVREAEPPPHRDRRVSQPDDTTIDLDALLVDGARAFREKRYEDSIAILKRAVGECPDSFRARYQLGLMFGQVGKLHEAITEIEHALSFEPAYFPALKNLALLHEKAGFRGRAVGLWERALAVAPDPTTRERIEAHMAKLSS